MQFRDSIPDPHTHNFKDNTHWRYFLKTALDRSCYISLCNFRISFRLVVKLIFNYAQIYESPYELRVRI